MALYQSKPSVIEAVQWTGDHDSENAVVAFAAPKVRIHGGPGTRLLSLLAGKDGAQEWVPVPPGHWLVNQPGDKSDIWPVAPDYFASKYEPFGGEVKERRVMVRRNRKGLLFGSTWSHDACWPTRLTHFYLGWWVLSVRTGGDG